MSAVAGGAACDGTPDEPPVPRGRRLSGSGRGITAERLGGLAVAAGLALWTVLVLWGFIDAARLILAVAGPWALLLAVLLFPLTIAVAPWWALYLTGSWHVVALIYGGSVFVALGVVVAALLWAYGAGREDQREPPASQHTAPSESQGHD